jgi:DNA-binding NarL/FixJ family response regulator
MGVQDSSSAVRDGTEKDLRRRVMLVDDHPMWIDALCSDLEADGFEIVATANTGTEALQRARATRPEVLVMDLQIPEPDGATCIELLMQEFPTLRILVLSASGERGDVLRAIKAGALGYLVKSASPDDLIDGVRKTAAGDPVFTPGLAGLVLGEFRRMVNVSSSHDDEGPVLTTRETEVLRRVAKGMAYREIAEELVVSHRTVQNHVQNVLRKLQLHNRVELTLYAIEQGFHEPDIPR